MDWRLLLRHHHWLTLRVGSHRVSLCARCSGTVLGYACSLTLQPLVYLVGFGLLAPFWQVIFAFVLALPSGIDWLTQTWGLRLSTNRIRFSAGLLIGGGACLLGFSSLPSITKFLILANSAVAIMCIGYLGRRLTRTNHPYSRVLPQIQSVVLSTQGEPN
jgi:uncharacterized membrane protein